MIEMIRENGGRGEERRRVVVEKQNKEKKKTKSYLRVVAIKILSNHITDDYDDNNPL